MSIGRWERVASKSWYHVSAIFVVSACVSCTLIVLISGLNIFNFKRRCKKLGKQGKFGENS
jgi:hypothetical protein